MTKSPQHTIELLTLTLNWADRRLCENPEDASFIIGTAMTKLAEYLGKETDYSSLLKEHLASQHQKGLDTGMAIAKGRY